MQKIQQNLSEFFQTQKVEELNGGVFVKDQLIGTSDTYVEHGLGRESQGYIVTKRNGSGVVYTSTTTNSRPKLELILRASASVTVDLYIF